MELITKEQYELLKEHFEGFDRNGLGFINRSQLDYVLFLSGEKLLESELQELTERIDPQGEEQITFERLISCLKAKKRIEMENRTQKRRKLIKACKKFDTQNTGSLSEIGLVSALRLARVEPNKYLLSDTIETAKLTSRGLIEYKKFIETVLNE